MSLKDAYVQKMEAQLKQFGAKFDHLKAAAQEKIADARISANEKINEGKAQLAGNQAQASAQVSDAQDRAGAKVSQGKAKLAELRDSTKAEYDALVAKFNELKSAGDDNWEAIKETFEKGWNDLTKKKTEYTA